MSQYYITEKYDSFCDIDQAIMFRESCMLSFQTSVHFNFLGSPWSPNIRGGITNPSANLLASRASAFQILLASRASDFYWPEELVIRVLLVSRSS